MKRLKLISVFFLIPFFVFSQITINQSDMPQVGDTIRLSKTFDLGTINYTQTGNDYTWDFSSLFPLTQSVDTFVSVQETPWVYQIVFFLSSNLAKPLQDFDLIPGFQVTDVYEFYKNSSSDFRLVGNGITLNSIPIPNKFEEPDIIFRFPLYAGNIDSSFSTYEFAIPGIGYLGGWKKRVNHADGWGTLITPYGTFETVRVKSDLIQYDSIFIDSLGIGFPVLRDYTEYKWLGNDFGLPLCTVTDDGIIPDVTYIDSVRNLFTGVVTKNIVDTKINIYPNPVKDKINVEVILNNPDEIEILLKSITGETIQQLFYDKQSEKKYKYSFTLNSHNLSKGLYFLMIKTNEKIYARKIILD